MTLEHGLEDFGNVLLVEVPYISTKVVEDTGKPPVPSIVHESPTRDWDHAKFAQVRLVKRPRVPVVGNSGFNERRSRRVFRRLELGQVNQDVLSSDQHGDVNESGSFAATVAPLCHVLVAREPLDHVRGFLGLWRILERVGDTYRGWFVVSGRSVVSRRGDELDRGVRIWRGSWVWGIPRCCG